MKEIERISLGLIDTSPMNPRKTFDADALRELSENIREQGLLQPITVRPVGERYEIVCGERRYRAYAMIYGEEGMAIATIPCIVREMTDEQAFDAMIAENLQRKDVDPMEEASAFSMLIERGDSMEDIATRFGKSVRFVGDRIRLNRLDDRLKHKVSDGSMTLGAARMASRLTPQEQGMLADDVDEDRVSVDDVNTWCDVHFMVIERTGWPDGFKGPCQCECSACEFNSANEGCLFHDMLTNSAKCTRREKFNAKRIAWYHQVIDDNDDVLLRKGDPLESGKTVITYDPGYGPAAAFDPDSQSKAFVDEMVSRGYEVRLISDLFERWTWYSDDDERLPELISRGIAYRVINIGQGYTGDMTMTVSYRKLKGDESAEAAETPELKAKRLAERHIDLRRRCMEDISGRLCELASERIETLANGNPLSAEDMAALMTLVVMGIGERKTLGIGDGDGDVMSWASSHLYEFDRVMRLFMLHSMAERKCMWDPTLNRLQLATLERLLPEETDEIINGCEVPMQAKLAKIEKELAELGYDKNGKKVE